MNGETEMMRAIRILLVEDNPGDVELTREALVNSKMRNLLDVVEDGEAAMAYLRRDAPYEAARTPDLIVLDLNLPKKDGREVLAEIKQDARLHRIPVVILTSSQAEADVVKAYDLHANCYITKPLTLDRFVEVVKSIKDFWFSIVHLPPEKD